MLSESDLSMQRTTKVFVGKFHLKPVGKPGTIMIISDATKYHRCATPTEPRPLKRVLEILMQSTWIYRNK